MVSIVTKKALFLTWQLWNSIRFPVRRHPIFLYARKPRQLEDEVFSLWRWLPGILLAFVILFAMILPLPALIASAGFIVVLPVLLILFNGTVLGTILVAGISTTIASARKNNRFELMSVSGEGALGVSWLLATGTVHRRNWLKTINRLVRWVVSLVLVLLGLAIVMLLFSIFTSESDALRQQQFCFLYEVINVSLLVAVLWLDHIQSLVVAVVLGILLPLITRLEVQLASVGTIIYLSIQSGIYLAIFVIYRLMDTIFTELWGNGFIVSITVTMLSIVTFYLIRDAIIGLLWRLIFIRYDASIEEYQNIVNSE